MSTKWYLAVDKSEYAQNVRTGDICHATQNERKHATLKASHTSMSLTKKAIDELKAIHQRKTGEDLSDDGAWSMGDIGSSGSSPS